MKTWGVFVPACVLLMFGGASLSDERIRGEVESLVLARVELGTGWPNLPLSAVLQDAAGADYALVVTPLNRLQESGASYLILAVEARAEDYIIAVERRPGARSRGARDFPVVYDDGRQIVVCLHSAEADDLSCLGFDLQRLSDTPLISHLPFSSENLGTPVIAPDPEISSMMAGVDPAALSGCVAQLSGAVPAAIGGATFSLITRHTLSAEPIARAGQLVLERMQARGLVVSVHRWSARGLSGCNIIGEMTGVQLPAEVVLVTAHLDDQPQKGPAPGADDNASGAAAVWTAMDILSRHRFQRTIRYAFFSGEEQGLYGSAGYAAEMAGRKENIVAVCNFDMIGWDALGGPVVRLHTRASNNPGYAGDAAIANVFIDVVKAYGLSGGIAPLLAADGLGSSDHSSFWNRGYAAILAIEDDRDDFNPNYHTSRDVLASLNLAYFANVVKAGVGLAAHLALLVKN